MKEQFIGEAVKLAPGATDARAMARGAPSAPGAFLWRNEEYVVAEVLEVWKEASDCRSGSSERYVRKHWFRIRTTSGHEMQIYFERQPRSGGSRKARWWLYTLSADP